MNLTGPYTLKTHIKAFIPQTLNPQPFKAFLSGLGSSATP